MSKLNLGRGRYAPGWPSVTETSPISNSHLPTKYYIDQPRMGRELPLIVSWDLLHVPERVTAERRDFANGATVTARCILKWDADSPTSSVELKLIIC